MKYGVVFPQYEIGSDPIVIRDYVQAIEDLGFDYLLAYDHVLGANPDREGGWNGPYTHENMFHEPFVLFGYLAGVTKHIEFTTGILILPQRQTALVAKQAAQVDVLSDGRLRLGIGIGWNHVEYESLNKNFKDRGKRSEEQIELLRELWTKPLVNFSGKDHKINDAGLNPLPVQQPIPIWFGGMADATLERMARLGDGWMPGHMSFDETQKMIEKLTSHLSDNRRSLSDFGIDVRISPSKQPQHEWSDFVRHWTTLGATHTGINTMGMNLQSIDEHLAIVQAFKAEMGF